MRRKRRRTVRRRANPHLRDGRTRSISRASCARSFPALQKPQVEQIVTWLQGYYTLEKAPRVIDPDKINADVTKLDTYCKQNPEANLVAAADDVMGEP